MRGFGRRLALVALAGAFAAGCGPSTGTPPGTGAAGNGGRGRIRWDARRRNDGRQRGGRDQRRSGQRGKRRRRRGRHERRRRRYERGWRRERYRRWRRRWARVRAVAAARGASARRQAAAVARRAARAAAAAAGAGGAPTTVEMLDITDVWSGHPVAFALVTRGDQQFAAFFDANRRMTVAQRTLGTTTWQLTRLDNTLGWDSHNYVAMAIDSTGFLHVVRQHAQRAAHLLTAARARWTRPAWRASRRWSAATSRASPTRVLPGPDGQPRVHLPRRRQRQRQPHLQHLRHGNARVAAAAGHAAHRRAGTAQRLPGRPGAGPRRLLSPGLGLA